MACLIQIRVPGKISPAPLVVFATLAIAVIASFVVTSSTAQATQRTSASKSDATSSINSASSAAATPIAGRLIFLPQEITSLGKNLNGFAPLGALADLNKDGKLDLVLVGLDTLGTVTVLLGNGDGTFQPPQTFNTGLSAAEAVTVADVNDDRKPDLIVTGCLSCPAAGVAVLLGNGDGSFKAGAVNSTGGVLTGPAAAVADINLDGNVDLVVVNSCGNISCSAFGTVAVLLGNGDGTFQPAVTHSAGGFNSSSVVVADVNGDAKPDLLVTNDCGQQSCTTYDRSHQIGVLLGNGDGTFQPVAGYASGGFGTSSLNVTDINRDGNLDLIAITRCAPACSPSSESNSGVGVLLGNGDGTFQSPTSYNVGGIVARNLTLIDANGDGKNDLIMTGFCNENSAGCGSALANIFALLGNGDGTFKPGVILNMLGPFGGPETLLTGDLNGDHKPDLLLVHGCNNRDCPVNDIEVGVMFNNRGAPAASISMTSSKNPVLLYQTVTYTARVSDGSNATLGGTVTFADGIDPVKTVPLSANQATYSSTYKTVANHQITATYSGVFQTNESRRSSALSEDAVAPTKTVLTSSASPSFTGQAVTFTATVASRYGAIPAGELVRFFDGTALLGSVALSGGKATLTTSKLAAKSHAMRAVYVGDSMFATSTGYLNQIVELPSTTTTLTCRPNPSTVGQLVTMTATVKSAGLATPAGRVIFTDGTTWIGASTLSGGAATVTKSNLVAGSHAITAKYNGDSQSAASTSAVVDQVVK